MTTRGVWQLVGLALVLYALASLRQRAPVPIVTTHEQWYDPVTGRWEQLR